MNTQALRVLFHRPEALVFRVSGKDARRYLHNRLTQDIKSLSQNEGRLCAALSPQGKCDGLFVVVAESDDQFIMYCDGGDRPEVEQAIARFLVSEQVTIDYLSGFTVSHFAAQNLELILDGLVHEPPYEEFQRTVMKNGCRVVLHRRTSFRGVDLVGKTEDVRALCAVAPFNSARELLESEQLIERIKAGRPEFPSEITGKRIFSEFGIKSAFSFQKGCYPGQEVIERADARGKLPRLLERFHIPESDSIQSGMAVSVLEKDGSLSTSGEVIAAAAQQGADSYCFALMKNSPELSGAKKFSIDGCPAVRIIPN